MKFGLAATLSVIFFALVRFEVTSAFVVEQFPRRNRRGQNLGHEKEKIRLGSSGIYSEVILKDEEAYWAPRLLAQSMSLPLTPPPTPTLPTPPPEECLVNVSNLSSASHWIALHTND
jgi:hypothetical protein